MCRVEIGDEEEFPYSKVLQLRWGSPLVKMTYKRIQALLKEYKEGRIDFVEMHYIIYLYIDKLRKEHQEEFPVPGWWDIKSARVLTRDRLTYTYSSKSSKKLAKKVEVCKVCNGYLPARKYYTVRLIEGEYWVVHKRCALHEI